MASTSASSGEPSESPLPPYVDYSSVSEADIARREGSQGTEESQRSNLNFPARLHFMISEMEKDGLGHIVSWDYHGRCFTIRDKDQLETKVLPSWFRQTKFSSFQRQLHFYGFRRMQTGPNVGSYYHEKFLRGKHFLTKYIRLKEKGRKRGKPKQSSLQEPNLTLYPQLPQTRAETRAVTSSQRITAVSDRAGSASIPLNNAYPHNEHILSGSRRQQNLDDLINSLQLLSSAEKEAAFLPSCSSLLLLQEEERRLRLASLALQNRPLQGGLSLGTPIDVSSLQLLDRLQQSRSSDFSALASAQLARAMTTPSMTEHPELMASVPPSLGISSALDSTSHSRDLIAALRSRREPPTRFFGLDPMLLGGTSTLPLHSTSNNMSLHRLTAGESSNSAIGEFLRGDILSRERQSQIGVEAKRSSSTSDDDEDEDTKPAAVRS